MASSISSGAVAASALLWTGRNRINALTILTDGTNAATVNLRDGLVVGAPIKVVGKCLGTDLINHIIFENPVVFEDGIYIELSGTGASTIVFYGG